jgi:hypothetical protein
MTLLTALIARTVAGEAVGDEEVASLGGAGEAGGRDA